MEYKKIGCSAGKTILVDPNKFDGMNSLNNISVPLEDLSIYVQLKTTKRARTLLQSNGEEDISYSSKGIKVDFIEGEEVSGKKVLTTRYTDLTTSFEDGQTNYDTQSLGITSIDIDFNSSNAPLIVINFVDLRGSSIFQNDSMLESSSKYSTLFQLPYPIFTLTIKGYYGLPVEYELHMTNFSSKFNSKTGNFEITANFVGYTYAMLSDMLIGYLRAISHTKIGAEKYRELKLANPYILTLDELITAVSQLDKNLKKLSSDDQVVINYSIYKEKLNQLGDFDINLNILPINMGIFQNDTVTEYLNITSVTEEKYNSAVEAYNQASLTSKTLFNTGNDLTFLEGEIDSRNFRVYKDLTLDLLNDDNRRDELITKLIDVPEDKITETRDDLLSFITEDKNGINGSITILDLKPILSQIKTKRNQLEETITSYDKIVGEKIKNTIKETLVSEEGDVGLDPTIRNVIEMFTVSVEVLMNVLYQVSSSALSNGKRTEQLKKYAPTINNPDGNRYDYKVDKITKNENLDVTYYPWPEYRKLDEKRGLIETYLGDPNELENPKDVNELAFIDDLLKSFYVSSQVEENTLILETKADNIWAPVNPLDTPLYSISQYPYSRVRKNLPDDVIRFFIDRASIYFGVTNKTLTENEINAFATAEAENIVLDIDNTIRLALSQYPLTAITSMNATANGVDVPMIKELVVGGETFYYYNYLFGDSTTVSIPDAQQIKLLPLNNLDGNSFEFNVQSSDTKEFSNQGNIFITNFTSSSPNDSNGDKILKLDDGGIYLKIFNKTEFEDSIKTLPSTLAATNVSIDLTDLEKSQTQFDKFVASNGLNQFGSSYGVQEFLTVKIDDKLSEAPFRTIFFGDNGGYRGTTTICKTRDLTTPSPYDIESDKTYFLFFKDVTTMSEFTSTGDNPIHKDTGQNKLYFNKNNKKEAGVTFPYVSFGVSYRNVFGVFDSSIGLFGSRLYYAQKTERAKAFLFLHTFPWNGLVGKKNKGIFNVNEILNTFGNRGGIISAPLLWAAFIGGLLWRADDTSEPIDPITFGVFDSEVEISSIYTTNYIPNLTYVVSKPSRLSYLRSNIGYEITKNYGMSFNENPNAHYLPIEDMLLQLPDQVKNEFKKAFFDFVISSKWKDVKNSLEIITGDDATWVNKWHLTPTYTTINDEKAIFKNTIKTNYKTENYSIITRVGNGDIDTKYNYVTELKDNSAAVNFILGLINEEVLISNNTYKIWNQERVANNETTSRGAVSFSKSDFELYINKVKSLLQVDTRTQEEKQKEKANKIFGTDKQNVIKFQLYRTCKNIYDKWIGGTTSPDKIIFRNGLPRRNGLDVELAKQRAITKNGNSTPTLIDSFRFVTRSFTDIGDDFYVNPKNIVNSLKENPGSSFYDVVTSLLSDNQFNFIALPNYINYDDYNELKTIFEPVSTIDSFGTGTTGPAFVCVYVGQTSKHLDMSNSYYEQDGIDFQCDKDNNLKKINAKDFLEDKKPYENNVAVFSVNYSQQNQNIFKDITLDQNEFTETNESLKVIDEIANKGAENRTTIGGQNLYDVYSVRSYTAGVEMMGNAMIQPMMYFQLNNIPMFHGAYLITHVKHAIKPNSMLTNFTGVRVRNIETPMLDTSLLYMPLLDSLLASESYGTKSVDSSVFSNSQYLNKSFFPIIATLIENGSINGNIEHGNITTSKIIVPTGIKITISPERKIKLIKEASDSLTEMLGDWVDWMIENQFTGNKGSFAHITSAFRTQQDQKEVSHQHGKNAAKEGTSNHSWGIAIDFQFFKKNGEKIEMYDNGEPNIKVGYDLNENESLVWLLENSYTYGWIIPEKLRDNTSLEEFWHFEYHGKSAKCILNNKPVIKGKQIDTTRIYNPIVKNPKDKDGKEAVYTSCTPVKIKGPKRLDGTEQDFSDYFIGNSADYWSLVAICALENDSNQGRCDVAQSIYNRLESGVYGYSTIKGLILANKQYEPVSRAKEEFRLIKDRQTAIRAFAKAKNTSTQIADAKILETEVAINTSSMVLSSKNFVGGRTDFYSSSIKNRYPEKGRLAAAVGVNVERNNQIFGWFVGPGSKEYGSTNPQPANEPNFDDIT